MILQIVSRLRTSNLWVAHMLVWIFLTVGPPKIKPSRVGVVRYVHVAEAQHARAENIHDVDVTVDKWFACCAGRTAHVTYVALRSRYAEPLLCNANTPPTSTTTNHEAAQPRTFLASPRPLPDHHRALQPSILPPQAGTPRTWLQKVRLPRRPPLLP